VSDPSSAGGLSRFDASQGPRMLGPNEGKYTDLGALGVRFMIWAEESGGGFEHCFAELGAALEGEKVPDFADLSKRYAIDFDPESLPRICAEYDLTHPMLEAGA